MREALVVSFSLFLCPSHVLPWELGPRAWTRFRLDFLARKHDRSFVLPHVRGPTRSGGLSFGAAKVVQ